MDVLIIAKLIDHINVVYAYFFSEKQSSFETLLEKDSSVSIHNPNLQILATEMFKIKNNQSPPITVDLFKQRNEQHYNLRNWT